MNRAFSPIRISDISLSFLSDQSDMFAKLKGIFFIYYYLYAG